MTLVPGKSRLELFNLRKNIMVKHLILWKLKEEFTAAEKEKIKAEIRELMKELQED